MVLKHPLGADYLAEDALDVEVEINAVELVMAQTFRHLQKV